MKTLFPVGIDQTWHVINAEGKVLGRLATEIANLLRGKNKPTFSPHNDNGDFVIVINAAKVTLTGKKLQNKIYYHHTEWVGGIRGVTAAKQLARHPERIIQDAVWGMLPKNIMGRHLLRKLKVYGGPDHPHKAQKPVERAVEHAVYVKQK
jgi:large subunit ribosomal protein L13